MGGARQAWRFQRSIVLESLKMNTPRKRELDLLRAARVQGGVDGGRRIATHGRRGDSKKHRFGIIENEHAAQARCGRRMSKVGSMEGGASRRAAGVAIQSSIVSASLKMSTPRRRERSFWFKPKNASAEGRNARQQ